MTARVVDASVLCAVFFREEHADTAQALLTGGEPLLAPDLIHAEVANVIWKRRQRKEIDDQEARQLLADFLAVPLETTSSAELVEPALELALRTGRTVYDCLYLALAVRGDSMLFTADRRLVRALARSPLKKHLAWIGERFD